MCEEQYTQIKTPVQTQSVHILAEHLEELCNITEDLIKAEIKAEQRVVRVTCGEQAEGAALGYSLRSPEQDQSQSAKVRLSPHSPSLPPLCQQKADL